MKESYDEELAIHIGLNPYADDGNVVGVASARGTGRLGTLSSEILTFVCRPCPVMGKTTRLGSLWRVSKWHGGVVEPSMSENFKRENREILSAPRRKRRGRSANLSEGTAGTHADRKSDDFIVLSTRANKAAAAVAESVEERKSPKGSIVDLLRTSRTPRRAWRHLRRKTITTGSEPLVRDRLTQRRSRMR